jgi:signal transduction histidine kinase
VRLNVRVFVWGAVATAVLVSVGVVARYGSSYSATQPWWLVFVLSLVASSTAVAVVLGVIYAGEGAGPDSRVTESVPGAGPHATDAVGRQQTNLVGQVEHVQQLTIDLFEAQRRFRRSVGHDLRSPLASIASAAEMLADGRQGQLNVDQEETCRLISESARRLIGQVEMLYARDEAFSLTVPLVDSFDLVELVQSVVSALRLAADAKDLEVELAFDAESIGMESDRRAIERIVANLVDNAIKFTDAGKVVVSVSAAEASAQIEVADTGIGIPFGDLPAVGTEFFRSSTVRDRQGAGIGVAVTRALADELGGSLTIDSELGSGTRATVVLPRYLDIA